MSFQLPLSSLASRGHPRHHCNQRMSDQGGAERVKNLEVSLRLFFLLLLFLALLIWLL